MTFDIIVTEEMVDRGAAAIANERAGRRGVPPVANVRDLVGAKVWGELLSDSRACLESALRAAGRLERIPKGAGICVYCGRQCHANESFVEELAVEHEHDCPWVLSRGNPGKPADLVRIIRAFRTR